MLFVVLMVIKATKDVIDSKREDSKEVEIFALFPRNHLRQKRGPCLVNSEEAGAWESFSGNSYQIV